MVQIDSFEWRCVCVREWFKNKLKYLCRIFRELGGGVPPIRENNKFFPLKNEKKIVQNALKHVK